MRRHRRAKRPLWHRHECWAGGGTRKALPRASLQLEEQLSTHQQEGRKLQQSIAAAQKSHLALSEEMKVTTPLGAVGERAMALLCCHACTLAYAALHLPILQKMRAAMENVSASLQQMRQRADMAWSRLPRMTGGMEAERTLIDMAKGSKGSK